LPRPIAHILIGSNGCHESFEFDFNQKMIFISNNSIHERSLGRNMSRVASVICMMLFSAMMIGFISPASAQVVPGLTLECDENQVEIDPGTT